jgi:hypothetical protein
VTVAPLEMRHYCLDPLNLVGFGEAVFLLGASGASPFARLHPGGEARGQPIAVTDLIGVVLRPALAS